CARGEWRPSVGRSARGFRPLPSRSRRRAARRRPGPRSPRARWDGRSSTAARTRAPGGRSGSRARGRLRDVAVPEVRAFRSRPLVLLLHHGDAVAGEGGAPLVLVQTRVGLAEDRVLERAVGRPERLEAVLLLHVFGDLEPTPRLDLPLGRAGPDG